MNFVWFRAGQPQKIACDAIKNEQREKKRKAIAFPSLSFAQRLAPRLHAQRRGLAPILCSTEHAAQTKRDSRS